MRDWPVQQTAWAAPQEGAVSTVGTAFARGSARGAAAAMEARIARIARRKLIRIVMMFWRRGRCLLSERMYCFGSWRDVV